LFEGVREGSNLPSGPSAPMFPQNPIINLKVVKKKEGPKGTSDLLLKKTQQAGLKDMTMPKTKQKKPSPSS